MQLFDDVVRRIKAAANIQTDSELAAFLGIKKPSVSAARKKGKVPATWVDKVSEKLAINRHWLLYGRGHPRVRITPVELEANPFLYFVPNKDEAYDAAKSFTISVYVDKYLRVELPKKLRHRITNEKMIELGKHIIAILHECDKDECEYIGSVISYFYEAQQKLS